MNKSALIGVHKVLAEIALGHSTNSAEKQATTLTILETTINIIYYYSGLDPIL